MTYKETIFKLFDLQKFVMKFGLDSMKRILSGLGNPERGGSFVHIAGTNGKGSTLAFLERVLQLSGLKTGLYTSPHLVTFRERIRTDGRLLSESEVVDLAGIVWEVQDPERPPTFFEFVTAMAFVHFARAKADIVLMETGLGGRLDSTNVLDPLISAVTNIGLEHTEQLGNTIKEIAFEKAGVIKEGKPFAAGRLVPEALEAMEKRARELHTRVYLSGRDYQVSSAHDPSGFPVISYEGRDWKLKDLKLGLIGSYQADNAALALAVLEELSRQGYKITPGAVREGLKTASWPGRGEVFPPGSWPMDKSGKAPLILDGAHNPDGARAFAELLASRSKNKLHLVAGVMADKDVAGVLSPIIRQADRLYLTRPEYQRAADPEELLRRLRREFGEPENLAGLYPHLSDAIKAAAEAAEESDLVAVSGSLFTVGEARAWLTGETELESN